MSFNLLMQKNVFALSTICLLTISGCKPINTTSTPSVASASDVERLSPTCSEITIEGASESAVEELLDALSTKSTVNKIEFWSTYGFKDRHWGHLARMTTVKSISMRHLYGLSVESFKNVAQCRSIISLTLEGGVAGDSVVAHLKDARQLTELVLIGKTFTEKSLDDLKELTHLKNLSFSLTDIPPDAIRKLQTMLPDTRVIVR